MKAVHIHAYRGADKLRYEDAPVPVIKDDEVLVKVYAAGVNPVDTKIRDGLWEQKKHYTFPLILGWHVAGIVEEAGSSVKTLQKGD